MARQQFVSAKLNEKRTTKHFIVVNFIQQPLPEGSSTGAGFDGQSGALGMGQRASTGLTTFNQFWAYVMPLLGAYMADQYWGRFKTIQVALAICILGHVLIIIAAIPPVIIHPNGAIACFALGIVIMGGKTTHLSDSDCC